MDKQATMDKTNVLEHRDDNDNSNGVSDGSKFESTTTKMTEYELEQKLFKNLKNLYKIIDKFKQNLLDDCLEILHSEFKRFDNCKQNVKE